MTKEKNSSKKGSDMKSLVVLWKEKEKKKKQDRLLQLKDERAKVIPEDKSNKFHYKI